jgi:hypothetical protein
VGIIEYFGAEFLCRLAVTDIQRLLAKAEEYVFLGILGSIYCIHWYNDINVLNQSTMFVTYHTPEVSFIVNGHEHHMRYYLVDVTYSSWSVFHKGCVLRQQEKYRFFLTKDVECAVGLLKKRFNILN